MQPIAIIATIFLFVIVPIFLIALVWFVLHRYFTVNKEAVKQIRTQKGKSKPLTFYLKSRGWGIAPIPFFGLRVGSPQNTAKIELKKNTISLTFLKNQEIPYSQLKLVDAIDFEISRNIIFHFRGSPFTKYGNIVDLSLLKEVIKILKSKGVPLSNRAQKIIVAS